MTEKEMAFIDKILKRKPQIIFSKTFITVSLKMLLKIGFRKIIFIQQWSYLHRFGQYLGFGLGGEQCERTRF
ncbi:MAG: hypothetical protein R2773_03790 [Flavobacteriaceae bacterium]